MVIVLQYILRNLKEKKMRTFLIVFSISLSCALFFASNAFSMTFINMYTQRMRQFSGNADIIIEPNSYSPAKYFSMTRTGEVADRCRYIIGTISTKGVYYPSQTEFQSLSIRGFNYKDLDIISPFFLSRQKDLLPFEGNKVIVGKRFIEKYNFNVGEMIDITIGKNKYKVQIVAVALPEYFFNDNFDQFTVIVPLKFLSRINKVYGRVNSVFIKPLHGDDKMALIGDLARIYKRYTVREPLNHAEVKANMKGVKTPFLLMTILVLCMSIFIIYTSFKVITMERLPVIGTFRSIGATKRTTDLILICESLIYGITGGIIGLLLGGLILYIMAGVMSIDAWSNTKMKVVINFSSGHVLSAFFLAISLALVSSIIPIIRVSKISIKDIVLNRMESTELNRGWKTPVGIFFCVSALCLPFISPDSQAVLLDSCAIILLVVGIIFLVPVITGGFISIFERLYSYIFGNEGVIAVKNIRGNRSILKNITLLAIGIAGILMINIVAQSVSIEVLNFYSTAKYEIQVHGWKMDRNTEGIIRSVKGVKQTCGVYKASNMEVIGYTNRINTIEGITGLFLDYWDLNLSEEQVNRLDESRNILLTNTLKEVLEVDLGSVLTLKTKRGKKRYKVIGFFDSVLSNGSYALISDKYYKLDMRNVFFNNILIKTKTGANPDKVLGLIKKKLEKRRPWLKTLKQIQESNIESNARIFIILQGFSGLTLVIGIFGVLNNLIINIIQRKRALAMFRSIGMSKMQIIKMLFIESLTGGLIGGITGTVTGLLLTVIIQVLLSALHTGINIHYSWRQSVLSALAGVIITIAATISPAIKSSRLNIIEAVKFE